MQVAEHIWVACKGDGPLTENVPTVGAAEGEDKRLHYFIGEGAHCMKAPP